MEWSTWVAGSPLTLLLRRSFPWQVVGVDASVHQLQHAHQVSVSGAVHACAGRARQTGHGCGAYDQGSQGGPEHACRAAAP